MKPLLRFFSACVVGLLLVTIAAAQSAKTPPSTEISFARFFGVCEAEYGSNTDTEKAVGECGLITTLVNQFNATNGRGIMVRTQPIEHSAYYNALGARLVGRDYPTVAIMHSSVLNDFAKRRLLTPLDAGFAAVGIDVNDFTPHARRAVTAGGQTFALPLDTHSWLWHSNLNLLKRAGLLNADGTPTVPRSPDALLAQARQFKAATGKPYFIWMTANDPAAFARTFITLVHQQGASLFRAGDNLQIDLRSTAARRAIALMKQLYDEGLTTRDLDYSAAVQAFINGQGGVMVNGTWLIDAMVQQSQRPGAALHNGYRAAPFGNLFGQEGAWADGHLLVLVEGGAKTPAQRDAALLFLRFMNDAGAIWARTGQLPTRQSVVASAAFKALPFRPQIVGLASSGVALPIGVARQVRVLSVIGENLAAIVTTDADAEVLLPKAEAALRRMLTREAQFLQGL